MKLEALQSRLRELGSLAVAFSGGVDSSFLLAVAQGVLGDRVLAVTATSMIHPRREKEEALRLALDRGIEHVLLPTHETERPEFLSNTPERCYHCKKELMNEVRRVGRERGIPHVAHAANMDDLLDYRPGWRAATEAGVLAPLVEAGLGKEEIRALSKEMGLPTWNKPAMACLASRIPYGEPITEQKLKRVEAAEDCLAEAGFSQYRVRYHGSVARIELDPRELDRIMEGELRRRVVEKLKGLGFLHVALDLEGYTPGSLNRSLEQARRNLL